MPHWFNTFRYRLTLLIGLLAITLGIGFVTVIYHIASQKLIAASAEELKSIGRSTASMLANTLNERQREVMLFSKRQIFENADSDIKPLRDAIELMQDSYSHYAWVGFADTQGTVIASGRGLLEGVDVSQRPWFTAGLTNPYIGDIHEAVLLAKNLQSTTPDEPLRFIDFAAPVIKRNGNLIGVIATHAHWSWITEVLASTLPQNAKSRQIEIFISDKNHQVLYPFKSIGAVSIPKTLNQEMINTPLLWNDGIKYLSSQVAVANDPSNDLGWQVIVRQPANQALATVTRLLQNLVWMSIAGTVLAMLLAYKLASEFSRPIEKLARIARQIQNGNERVNFSVNHKLAEITSLADSLQTMTLGLINREHALAEINRTLEQKVQERTVALESANQELTQLARKDALTGISNRLAMTEVIKHEFLMYKRDKTCFAIILIDIDHFKEINDNFGHKQGDLVLKRFAQLLQQAVRQTDFVARFGGEEFLVLLPNTDDAAHAVAEKIRSSIENAVFAINRQITVSLGVAITRPDDHTQDDLIHRADVALYRAKNGGRNRVVMAESPAD